MIETRAARLGEVTIRRVFGDMALHKDWAQETGYVATHCATSAGKNRADIALVVAAMDFLHRGLAQTFIIVSDDRDFDPLVSHLREQGCNAERIGKPAPQPTKAPSAPVKSKRAVGVDETLRKVRAMIAGAGDTGYPIQSLGVALSREGICLTDTFQLYEQDRDLISDLMEENSNRRTRQKELDIRVIVGNPPYSIGQGSENDNSKNLSYPRLDQRIRETYAERSSGVLARGLYDSYIRAIRWASDRIGDAGIVGYVSNAGVIVKSGVCPSGSVPVRLIVHRYSILKPDVIHDQLQLVEPLDPLPAFLGGLEQFEHHR